MRNPNRSVSSIELCEHFGLLHSSVGNPNSFRRLTLQLGLEPPKVGFCATLMAETTSREETAFDAKRKPDSCCEAKEEERSNKIQKLEVVEGESCNAVKNGENGDHKQSDDMSSVAEGKDDGLVGADVVAGEADDEGDEEEDYEDDDDSEDGENSTGKAAEDRKGKGIMKDDKGKGKLIEEEDNDDEEDSSDDGSELGSEESDLSDDPLAEVDMGNILPSRTRRRTVNPGVYFATDLGNDDDDSSDSDA